MRHGASPFLSILQWLPGTGTAAGVFRLLDLICEPITPRQAVSVPADPLPGRPDSLKPLLLRFRTMGMGICIANTCLINTGWRWRWAWRSQWWWGLKDGPTVALAKHHPGVPRGSWRWGVAHDAAHSGRSLPDGLT